MEPNPRVPDFLRAVTWVECGVVASAALLLLTMPKRGGQDIWAWITPPLNARYVGVIYLAALVALLVFAVHGRWNPGRLVLWEIFVFTTAIMVVMLAYAGRFEWARVATWVFWPLYLFLPVNSAVFLWRLRDWRAPEPLIHARGALTVLALLLGGYGLALLVIPERATDFWPWPVDAFHARIYAATYLTPAAGAWVLRSGAYPRGAADARDHARHLRGRGADRRADQHDVLRHQPRADPGRRRAAAQRSTRECSGCHDSVTGWPISQRSDAWETCVFCSSATIRVSGPSSTITCVVVPT